MDGPTHPNHSITGHQISAASPLVGGDFGTVKLERPPADMPRDPAWTAPGMKGYDPTHGPSGPHGDGIAGGPFWRP